MKTRRLIGLVVAAVALGIVVSTFEGASRYVDFAQARAMNQGRSQPATVHVIGALTETNTEPRGAIEESADKLSFWFSLTDGRGEVLRVHYPHPVPADFRRSEQVVVIGHATDTHFEAERLLLKCPSKYEAEEGLRKTAAQ